MATPLTDSQFRAAATKWKLDYEFYSGAIGRPGSFAPIGFIIHHTGGAFTESKGYLDFLFKTGRPAEGIPAQLCQFSGGPSGKIYAGKINARANHAGAGNLKTRQLVGAENYNGYSTEIQPGPDDYTSGNGLYYGLEINYPGTVPMKPAQWDSAVRLGALLMDAHNWTSLSCIGHREHSRRKWDPGKVLLYEYRKAVRDLLNKGPGGNVVSATGPEKWDKADWAAFEARAETFAVAVWNKRKESPLDPTKSYNMTTYTTYGWRDNKWLLEGQAKIGAQLGALENLLQQVLSKPGQPIDMKAVEEASLSGAMRAMAELHATITISPTQGDL